MNRWTYQGASPRLSVEPLLFQPGNDRMPGHALVVGHRPLDRLGQLEGDLPLPDGAAWTADRRSPAPGTDRAAAPPG